MISDRHDLRERDNRFDSTHACVNGTRLKMLSGCGPRSFVGNVDCSSPSTFAWTVLAVFSQVQIFRLSVLFQVSENMEPPRVIKISPRASIFPRPVRAFASAPELDISVTRNPRARELQVCAAGVTPAGHTRSSPRSPAPSLASCSRCVNVTTSELWIQGGECLLVVVAVAGCLPDARHSKIDL
jgi:hypothetical protein